MIRGVGICFNILYYVPSRSIGEVSLLDFERDDSGQTYFITGDGISFDFEVRISPVPHDDLGGVKLYIVYCTACTKKTRIKMPNGWRTIKSLVHKTRLHNSRRGKEMAESFSREKLRHAPQKEGG